jgi:hypothetical protein
MKKRLYIALRAFFIVSFTTANIWLIANKHYNYAISISVIISLMWTLNVKDLALANTYDRIAYILGALTGTILTLYMPIILGYEH